VKSLPPWADGPFELLVHAEGHLQRGDDFDRRMALISFDNAIEVAISTYLKLKPIQRGNREYEREKVDKWLNDYHSKLAFVEFELTQRGLPWAVERSYFVWFHDHRNEQYHDPRNRTPGKSDLVHVRTAALWIFALLYDDPDIEKRLEQELLDTSPPRPPQRNRTYDRAIDHKHGMVILAGQTFYTSEALFGADYAAYQAEGQRLCQGLLDDEDGA